MTVEKHGPIMLTIRVSTRRFSEKGTHLLHVLDVGVCPSNSVFEMVTRPQLFSDPVLEPVSSRNADSQCQTSFDAQLRRICSDRSRRCPLYQGIS